MAADPPRPPLRQEPGAPGATHHWLTLVVARPGPVEPVPVPGARVVVRELPRGALRPGAVVARGTTAPDGTLALLLPAGRYAVAARHGEEGRAATVRLEHAGRARLLLESRGRRVRLVVEARRATGEAVAEAPVEIRTVPAGTLAARSATDGDGVAVVALPPGAYEVRIGTSAARTYLEADTQVSLTADATRLPEARPLSRYAQRARHATSYAAPFDVAHLRDEAWN